MPHQLKAFALLGELFTEAEAEERGVPFGTPAYREVWILVPRQSGKTTIILVTLCDRSMFWERFNGRAFTGLYTAQTGKAARRKILQDMVPIIEAAPAVNKRVDRVLRGVGSEVVIWRNGSRFYPGNNTESASHGETIDVGIIDEAFDDVDDRREQAMIPAMATRPMGQIVGASTAGTAASLYLARKMRIGRAATIANSGSGVAYLEYSAPADADPYDHDLWWAVHPALGLTVPLAVMQHAADTMEPAEFRRAWLNVPTSGIIEAVIPADSWEKVTGSKKRPRTKSGRLVWAVDVTPDRSRAAIAVCDRKDDERRTELVDYRPGTDWVVDRVAELVAKYGGPVVVDGRGPAANLADDDGADGWQKLNSEDFVLACADFFDRIASAQVVVAGNAALTRSVAAAEVRRSGDRRVWSRSLSRGDIAPLVAATVATSAKIDEKPAKVAPYVL